MSSSVVKNAFFINVCLMLFNAILNGFFRFFLLQKIKLFK